MCVFSKACRFIEDDARFKLVRHKRDRVDWFEDWQDVAYNEYRAKRNKERYVVSRVTPNLFCQFVQG